MKNKLLENVENLQKKQKIVDFRVGDNVKVHVRVKEGTKERIQIFEGLIIAKKGSGSSSNFTVRKISYGIGVEKTFLVNSPLISEIEISRSNKVRRAKLYFMRNRQGKAAKLKEVKRK